MTLVKLQDPTQFAGGYSLDLYCDHAAGDYRHDSSFPQNYFGETFSECAKQARKDGWKIHSATRTATCPACAKVLERRK